MTDPLPLLLALSVGTIAVARAVRLVTADDYPPAVWVRLRYLTWAAQTPRRQRWDSLVTCPFCFAPYAAAADLAWALLAGLDWTGDLSWSSAWWVVNVWAAVSYLAAVFVALTTPSPEE